MSWHPFEVHETYSVSFVVPRCEAYLASGKIVAVEEKRRLLQTMSERAPVSIVWSPFSDKGWGASPFNPNCWRTVDGQLILPSSFPIPDLPGDAVV